MAYVEQGKDTCSAFTTGEGADFEQALLFVGGVHFYRFSNDRGTEYDRLIVDGARGHGRDKVEIMLAGLISEINRTPGDAAAGRVETGVRVRSLKHVPVRKDVEVGSEQGVMGVHENVPGV